MKKLLLLSISLNCVLLMIILHTLMAPRDLVAPFSVPMLKTYARPAAVKETSGVTQSPPFHWNQVESEDFPTYITRLRAIGCPEATIRRIVTGEISEIYVEKRRELETRSGYTAVPSQIKKLDQEQSALVATLLANPETERRTGANAAISHNIAQERPARYPLAAFGPAPLAANGRNVTGSSSSNASLSKFSGELPAGQVLSQITQNFVSDLGGQNQNPEDPLYRARWTRAQRIADDRIRSLMGADYYNAYQLEAGKKAYEEALSKQ